MPIETVILGALAGGAVIAAAAARQVFKARRRTRDALLVKLAEAEGGTHHAGHLLQAGHVQLRRPVGNVLLGHLPSQSGPISNELVLLVGVSRVLPPLHLEPRWGERHLERTLEREHVELADPAFDKAYEASGSDHLTVRTLLGSRARELCLAQARAGTWAELTIDLEQVSAAGGSVLCIARAGWYDDQPHLRAFLDFGCQLAEELIRCWDAPWERIAERWHLDWTAREGMAYRRLDGTVEGIAIQIREGTDRRGHKTEVRAPAAMPDGLTVAHLDTAEDQGWIGLRRKLGNPVLDMLVAVKAHDWKGACTLLSDEDLTAGLLEVVHAHPGSELGRGKIRLVLPGHAHDQLEPAVEKVLALARALKEKAS